MENKDIKPFLNGACYVYQYTKTVIPPQKAADLMQALNVKSVRSWSHITWLLKNPDTINETLAQEFHDMYEMLKKAGVEQLVGMSHSWFLPESCQAKPGDSFAVPGRDVSNGSEYREFLQMHEDSWKTLAKEFPEIIYWETGNEYNHDPFLHPFDYSNDPEKNKFTLKEKAEIATDMMFSAAKGIHAANPKAKIIMPGMAPIGEHGLGVVEDNVRVDYGGMVNTLKQIYLNIESGQFGSTDPRDFFDSLCWHPYYAVQQSDQSWKWQVPDDKWVELNNSVYQVAIDHGDLNINCYFSEFGFNDFGDSATDISLVEHVITGMNVIREKLPYVESVHAYRMFEQLDVEGVVDNYAFFHTDDSGTHPKKRAYALQKAYGGTIPL